MPKPTARRLERDEAQTAALDGTRMTHGLVLVPGRRQRLGDQLYGQILDQIVSGRLKEGERLPTEKEICAMFGVSRPVVRDALLRLRADGLLQARQGSGTYVMRRPADRLKKFATTAELAVFLRCLEARLPLEATCAKLAAERRTPGQLARIQSAHDRLKRDISETGHMTPESDLAFHATIAAATGNEFFSDLLQHIHEAVSGFMKLSLSLTRTSSRDRVRQVLDEHTYILEAIQAQEPEEAETAMAFHIGQSRRRVTDRRRDK
ncbi:MAG: FadR/GntR family transcriptional regulator [Pseudomonadota bacterium]|nr:FadR/GntR family transcriptional regulator [Pseudomonadota bacterium]